MAKLTKAQLRKWHRRTVSLENRARALMNDMTRVLGFDDVNTDGIDSVVHTLECLGETLSKPTLEMWNIAAPAVTNGEQK